MSAHRYDCRVRWSDVDAYGHVNNVTYAEYVQEARIAAIASRLTDRAGEYVIAQLDLTYRRPMFFRQEPYVIETYVTRVGRSSFDLTADIVDAADGAGGGGVGLLARAEATIVGFDATASRSRPLDDAERAALDDLRSDRPAAG